MTSARCNFYVFRGHRMSLAIPVAGAVGGIAGVQNRFGQYLERLRAEGRVQSVQRGRAERKPRSRPAGGPGVAGGIMSAGSTRTMPRRRQRQRKRARRSFRRPSRAITMQWPRFKLVKFKVVTAYSLVQAAPGTTAQYLLQANSLADPHGAAGGNLPLGLDQWAAMYGKYVVVGSRHYVKAHNVSSTGSITYGLSLRAPGESSTLATNEAYLELPITRSKILSPDQDHSGLGVSFAAKRYFHVRKFMDAENLHGTLSVTPGNPSRLAYVSFWFGDTNATEGYTIEGYITSEYTCLLFDPITPSRSGL